MGIIDNSIIKIEIDGIEFNAKRGSKIIEVADDVGIYIPRFCYHKKLSIAANCRMCLVEVEKAPKLFPACATPITDGMKIYTNTEKVIDAQRSVMEFLLINHPLDCPICDQGGECELQDLAIGYGCSFSRFIEKKRSFTDYDFGPLVSTDVTRCILCSRCVRFCEEIAGTEEIGIINRGSNSRIFTFLKEQLRSEVSGNVIDLCPVGALTAKPSKFKFRAWELVQNSFISYHDCIGSNLYVHVFRDKVIRVVPKRNEMLNESWISNRDRFSYEGLYNQDRIKFPMLKEDGKWKHVSWDDALHYTFNKLVDIRSKFGSDQIAGVASTNSTMEEFYILQKFIRSQGSNNLDHRLKQLDFANQEKFPYFPGLNININDLDKMDFVFLIGSDIVKEQPTIAIKLRKIIKNGGKVFILNPVDFKLYMNLSDKYIVNPAKFLCVLKSIIKNYYAKFNNKTDFDNIESLFSDINDTSIYSEITDALLKAKNKLILLGYYTYSSPDYSKIVSLSSLLAKMSSAKYGIMTDGSNSSGAWITGFIPHRLPDGKLIPQNAGFDAFNIFSKNLKAYILFGLEIEKDSLYPDMCINALKNANFVLSFSSFKSSVLLDTCDIILPIASSYENSGTFVNVSGVWQSFTSVVPCEYEVKLGWEALSQLGTYFKLPGFFYKNELSILNEIKSLVCIKPLVWEPVISSNLSTCINSDVIIIPSISQYDNDSLVRRAQSLQKAQTKNDNILKCNRLTYNLLKVEQNNLVLTIDGEKKEYSIFIDDSISNNSIFIESCNIKNRCDFKFPYESISSYRV